MAEPAVKVKTRMSATGKNRGFTLLEVVAATALLGIGVAVLIEGFSRSVSFLPVLRDRQSLVIEATNGAALLSTGTLVGKGGRGSDPMVWWQWEPGRPQASGEESIVVLGRVAVVREPSGWAGWRQSFSLITYGGDSR